MLSYSAHKDAHACCLMLWHRVPKLSACFRTGSSLAWSQGTQSPVGSPQQSMERRQHSPGSPSRLSFSTSLALSPETELLQDDGSHSSAESVRPDESGNETPRKRSPNRSACLVMLSHQATKLAFVPQSDLIFSSLRPSAVASVGLPMLHPDCDR